MGGSIKFLDNVKRKHTFKALNLDIYFSPLFKKKSEISRSAKVTSCEGQKVTYIINGK